MGNNIDYFIFPFIDQKIFSKFVYEYKKGNPPVKIYENSSIKISVEDRENNIFGYANFYPTKFC